MANLGRLRWAVPTSASPAASTIVVGRTLRGLADGFVSVLLAQYLLALGMSPVQIGAIITATLLGSAALTLAFGLRAYRYRSTTLLLAACVLMVITGLGFAVASSFWVLMVVALAGTLNPSAGDVSVFLPTEQALLAGEVAMADRPRLYAAYNVGGTLAGAVGALCSSLPERLASATGLGVVVTQRLGFVLYAVVAVVIAARYRHLAVQRAGSDHARRDGRGGLGSSRRIVLVLSALFSLDSAGSGFVVTSLLVLWLHLRYDLSAGVTGAVFFVAGLLGGVSQTLAPVLARRIGLVRTMVTTHIPANVLLALTPFAPTGGVAIAMLLVRALFAQMDAPARQAFTMAVVPPEHRAAASSVTNVPRSLASAATPLLAGAILASSTFGWTLVIAGLTKVSYDLILLASFRGHPLHDDEPAPAVPGTS